MNTAKVVTVQGVKGGVGNTTIVANLAVSLVNIGYQVICVDACKSNDLRWHFGGNAELTNGLFSSIIENTPWESSAYTDNSGVTFFPFGDVSDLKSTNIASIQPIDLLLNKLDFADYPTIILVDLPHYIDALSQPVSKTVHAKIISANSDVANFTKLNNSVKSNPENFVVLNHFKPQHGLITDLHTLISTGLNSDKFLGTVLNDQFVHEALAQNSCAVQLNQYRKSSKDFNQIALKLATCLFDLQEMHKLLMKRAENLL